MIACPTTPVAVASPWSRLCLCETTPEGYAQNWSVAEVCEFIGRQWGDFEVAEHLRCAGRGRQSRAEIHSCPIARHWRRPGVQNCFGRAADCRHRHACLSLKWFDYREWISRMISRNKSARYGQRSPRMPALAATTFFGDPELDGLAPGWCFAQ